MKKKTIISLILKSLVVICVIAGLWYGLYHGRVKGAKNFLYFTTLSNVFMAAFEAVFIGFMVHALIKDKYQYPRVLYLLEEIFCVSITITFVIYNFVLLPGLLIFPNESTPGYNPLHFGSIMLHMVSPIIAVVDYILFTRDVKFKKVECLYAGIPVVSYFIFALIGYIFKWDFGFDKNYPYFFLNYDNPAGFFGFSSEMPYFMGNFYWIIIGLLLVFGISVALLAIVNKLSNKKRTK